MFDATKPGRWNVVLGIDFKRLKALQQMKSSLLDFRDLRLYVDLVFLVGLTASLCAGFGV